MKTLHAFQACLFGHSSTSPCGGEGGIRTHGPGERTPLFENGAFVHSATSPQNRAYAPPQVVYQRSLDDPRQVERTSAVRYPDTAV